MSTTSSGQIIDYQETKKYNRLFAALQSSYWMSFCSLIGFSTVLLNAMNFTAGQVGSILAAASTASIVAQPMLAALVSRHPHRGLHRLILASLVAAILSTLLLFPAAGRFTLTLVAFALIGMSEIALQSFINSFFLQYVNAGHKLSFGLTRGLGSLAYALCGAAVGILIGRVGPSAILPVHIGFLVLTILIALTLNPTGTVLESYPSSPSRGSGSIGRMIKERPAMAVLLVAATLAFISFNSLITFTPMILRSVGGTDADMGIIVFLTAASEVPAMFLFSRLQRRFGSERLLFIAFLFLLMKPILFALSPNRTVLFLIQPVQMAGYGIFIPASVHYVNEVLPPDLRIRGQALISAACFGFAQVIGNLAGGFIIEFGGLRLFFTLNIAFAAVAFLLILFIPDRHRTKV